MDGENAKSITVGVVAADEMVVMSSQVRKNATLTTEALHAILRASYKADFSKLALDEEGDLVAITELPKDFSASAFKEALSSVATLADEALGILGTSRTLSRPTTPDVSAGRGATLPILRGVFELAYDPAKWRVNPSTEPGETEFQHLSGDAGVKVIAERIEFPRENFRSIVVENAKTSAPDIVVISETPRTVNGLKVVLLRYGGTTNGVKFTFYNQMYSDASGTIQLAAWTGTNLFEEYERDFLEFFAGLRKLR